MNTVSIVLLVIFIFLFVLIVYPLIKLRSRISKSIYDEGLPYLTDLNKSLVTISSATIALTVSFISDQPLIKDLLLMTWILLIACILFGILIMLSSFIKKLINSVHLKIFKDVIIDTKTDNIDDEEKKKYRKDLKSVRHFHLLNSTYYYLIVLFVFLQSYSFVSALVYLLMAGYKLL